MSAFCTWLRACFGRAWRHRRFMMALGPFPSDESLDGHPVSLPGSLRLVNGAEFAPRQAASPRHRYSQPSQPLVQSP
jgi:hypothetical protein